MDLGDFDCKEKESFLEKGKKKLGNLECSGRKEAKLH